MSPDPTRKVEEPDPVRYAAAVEEIERILQSIDRDEVDLDELGAKVERAVELLKVCRAKLQATEARVVEVLEGLTADEDAAARAAPEAPRASDAASPTKRSRARRSKVEREGTEPASGSAAGGDKGTGDGDDEELPF